MLTEGQGYVVAVLAMFIGAAAGFLVQRTAAAIRKNGDWVTIPSWKKFYMSFMGSIAAFAAGTFVLIDAPTFSPERVLAEMWLYQTFAAWGAPFVLDVGAELVGAALRKGGKRE